jgi:hypothetical protein
VLPKRIALLFLGIASPAMLICFWLGGRVGEVVFAGLAVGFPVALAIVGASRRGRLGPLQIPLLLLLLVLEGSVLGMLALGGRLDELPWVGGLPLAAALQLYGMWLLPLPLVALAYALTFDRFTLTEDDLARVREAAAKED